MKEIEISKKREIKHLTIKELYDMLAPLIEKGIDGELVAHGCYLLDDIIYDEDDKILFFSVGNNWFLEQEEKRQEDERQEKERKNKKTSKKFWSSWR